MEYHQVRSKGFAIDQDLAENLSMSDELFSWEEDLNPFPFFEAFEEKFNFSPFAIKIFGMETSHDGALETLQGFDYDLTYVLFDESVDTYFSDEWHQLVNFLEAHDTEMIEGGWVEGY